MNDVFLSIKNRNKHLHDSLKQLGSLVVISNDYIKKKRFQNLCLNIRKNGAYSKVFFKLWIENS